jgi:hypothetical protein
MNNQLEIKILSPTAILGYGFPASSFEAGLERHPDAIAVDAGSIDPGPYYLGAGVSFTDRGAVKRDLRLMLKAGRELKVPVITEPSSMPRCSMWFSRKLDESAFLGRGRSWNG